MPRSKELEQLLADSKKVSGAKPSQPSGGGLKSLLGTVGSFFGEVESDKPTPSTEQQSVPEVEFNTVSADDLSQTPFEDIYQQASVPQSDCSIEELATLIQDPDIAAQPPAMKAQFISFTLKARNVTVRAPIDDATAKDKALDAYQKMLTDRAVQTQTDNEAQITALQDEVTKFMEQKQAEIDTLRQDSSEKNRQAAAFQQRRMAEERRLSDLISPFLKGEPNPVTVGNTP